MNYNLTVQNEAVLEIKEAFEWYEKIREGLGYELMEEIEACYHKISLNPEYYSYVNEKYRRIRTSRFPYLIIYSIELNDVIVWYVVHAKQKKRGK